MKKNFWSLFALFIFVLHSRVAHGQTTDSIGGCLIIHVQNTNAAAPDLASICNRFPARPWAEAPSFQSLYSWAPMALVQAFTEAERGLTGSINGIGSDKNIRIIILDDGLVNAGITLDNVRWTGNTIDIFITAGLLDFVETTCSSYMLDLLKGTSDELPGMGFQEWINKIKSADAPDLAHWRAPWPGPRATSLSWNLHYIRVPASSVYTFIFAHELSHIALRLPSGGATTEEQLQREMTVDLYAFNHITSLSPHAEQMDSRGDLAPTFVINFLAATSYFQRSRDGIIVKSKGMQLLNLAPASDWPKRAQQIINQWRKICYQVGGQVRGKMCPKPDPMAFVNTSQSRLNDAARYFHSPL